MSDDLRRSLRALPDFVAALPEFDVEATPPEPEQLCLAWLAAAWAGGLAQPHAFSLATAASDGRPSSRILILKGLDRRGWHFASMATSRKGVELAANPQAAMNFSWLELGRQVRLTGPVLALPEAESERDWQERPRSDGRSNPQWQLWTLQPDEIEFWQARLDRKHQRLFYRRERPDAGWSKSLG